VDVTRALARFVVTSKPGDIPAAAYREATRSLVNWMGCALGGAHHEALLRLELDGDSVVLEDRDQILAQPRLVALSGAGPEERAAPARVICGLGGNGAVARRSCR